VRVPEGAVAISMSPALIVDDDPRMRARLRRLLDECLGGEVAAIEADCLAAARELAGRTALALALIDVGLPDGSGIDFIGWLRERQPQAALLIVSAYGEEDTVLAALRAGAIGYLLKEREDVELLQSLRSIQHGGAPIDPFVARRLLAVWTQVLMTVPAQNAMAVPRVAISAVARDAVDEDLTEREREILALVARGYSNREIAELIALSRYTVEDYTKRIYRKLAVNSRTAAVFEAQSLGLLS
jgi:RNA polymerase sigma factor (sigma-70 family)